MLVVMLVNKASCEDTDMAQHTQLCVVNDRDTHRVTGCVFAMPSVCTAVLGCTPA